MENHVCDMCCERAPEWAWETAGRGWKFLCGSCYDHASGIIQMYCEAYSALKYYPRFNYDTRTVS